MTPALRHLVSTYLQIRNRTAVGSPEPPSGADSAAGVDRFPSAPACLSQNEQQGSPDANDTRARKTLLLQVRTPEGHKAVRIRNGRT